jgi:hypothetical protein
MKKVNKFFVDFVYKQDVLSEKEKVFITTWGIKTTDFIKSLSAGIISFLVLRYIFITKMYKSSGFEITLLTMFILLIIIIKFNFGGKKEE